jgi:hypothetical protein
MRDLLAEIQFYSEFFERTRDARRKLTIVSAAGKYPESGK